MSKTNSPQIANRTRITQNLRTNCCLDCLWHIAIINRGNPDTRLPCNSPPRGPDSNNRENGEGVPQPRVSVGRVIFFQDLGEGIAAPASSRRAASVRAGKTDGVAASATGEKGLFFRGAGDDGKLAAGASVDVIVVETLRDEDKICDAEVDGKSDYRWD